MRIGPEYGDPYYYRGLLCRQSGRYDEAVADFTLAFDRYETREVKARVLNARGFSYSRLNDHSRAEADYTEAINMDPGDTQSHMNRAYLYRLMNRTEEAVGDYDDVISQDPRNGEAFMGRGMSYHSLGNYRRAERDIQMSRYLRPY